MFVATWIQLEIIILSKVNQKEKDKYHMLSHIWNLKYGTNEPNRYINIENRIVIAKRQREGVEGTGNLGLINAKYSLWNG